MRPRNPVAIGLALTLAAVFAAPASAEDGYDHGRLRHVEAGVTLQRATDTGAEEALGNEPFLPGDRIWTDASGRAEFQFPDGSSVRLDRRSKLDYSGHDEGRDERVVLRLWSGSVIVHSRRGSARLEVETPAGMVQAAEMSVVRVDVDGGEARVSVYDGEAVLDDGQARTRITAGERTFARWGARAEEPQRFDAGEMDEFAGWDEEREVEARIAAADSRYLPAELQPYSEELEQNGDWRYESSVGYVWVPQVESGWQPYTNGRWSWTPYGWTWVPFDRWGWAPFHYGRWDYAASFGWYWMPGRTWGPAWVSWAAGGGYVGWCPLGRYDRPVVGWGDRRGHYDRLDGRAVPRPRGSTFGRGPMDAWQVVRSGELGHRNIARVRLPAGRVAPTSLRVADSPSLRPSRDGSVLRPESAVPRMVSTRQTPGDFVRELGVDNRTTIPAPWTRGYGPPPAGVDGARYGVPRDRDAGQRESTGAGRGGAATAGGTASSGTATGSTAGSSGTAPSGGSEASSAAPRNGRSVPWFRPADESQRSGTSARPSGGASSQGGSSTSAARPAGRAESSRSRDDSGGSPRSYGGSSSEPRSYGGAQPRSHGGGEVRSSGGGSGGNGGSQSRPSGGSRPAGGEARPSGGGGAAPREHAAPRSRNRD